MIIKFLKINLGPLSKKTFQAGFWQTLLKALTRGLNFISSIILARIFIPKDFGVITIVFLILEGVNTFSQLGLNQAVIQKRGKIKEDLNSVWTINFIRGIILALVLFFLAPFLGKFFDNQRIISLLKLISLSELIKGFNNLSLEVFTRKLNFKKLFIYNSLVSLTEVVVCLILAFWLRDIQAFVIANIISKVIGLIASFKISKFRPKVTLNLRRIKKLFGYGRFVLLNGIVLFLINQFDAIFIARHFDAKTLGFYFMALKFSVLIIFEIGQIISDVSFPAYAKIQKNKQRLKSGFLKIIKSFLLISLPLAGALTFLIPAIIPFLLGNNWLAIIPLIRLLVLLGLLKSLKVVLAPIFRATGRISLLFYLTSLQAIIFIISIYPLTDKFNLFGVILANCLAYGVVDLIMAVKICKTYFDKILV